MIPNVWAVHRNPNLWKDPHVFKPERFLNEDGSALLPKPEYIISFSVGKYEEHMQFHLKKKLS